MKVLVLLKETPDMERVRFDSINGVVDRSSASAEINPFDLYALQAAVDIEGASVCALTMGPENAARSLRDAYARGADSCILLTDRRFGGSDTYATSLTLASAIKTLEYDLIICGEKSVDGDTAQVGAEVAEILDIPHSYYVEKISVIGDGSITVETAELCGHRQTRRMSMPALISVNRAVAQPRLPSLKRKLESLKAEISLIRAADLPWLKAEDTGFNGSPTKVVKIEVPAAVTREPRIYKNNPDGFIAGLKAVW